MKYKTTAKAIRQFTPSNYLISAGYGDLQDLLSFHEPSAYTCGVYGWNFDVYDVHGVTICTGYRGMPGRRANQIREAERAARMVRSYESGLTWEEQKATVEKLLLLFLEANSPNGGAVHFPATVEEVKAFAKA